MSSAGLGWIQVVLSYVLVIYIYVIIKIASYSAGYALHAYICAG